VELGLREENLSNGQTENATNELVSMPHFYRVRVACLEGVLKELSSARCYPSQGRGARPWHCAGANDFVECPVESNLEAPILKKATRRFLDPRFIKKEHHPVLWGPPFQRTDMTHYEQAFSVSGKEFRDADLASEAAETVRAMHRVLRAWHKGAM
jgi:hypothetical protein